MPGANKPFDHVPEEGRRPKRKCKVCGVTTKKYKDFCSEHVAQTPYVQALLLRMAVQHASSVER